MRKLRLDTDSNVSIDEPIIDSERKLRLADDEILAKADKLLKLSDILADRDARHKRETRSMRAEIDSLKSELLDYGREHLLEKLTASTATVEFTTRVSRNIDPKAFLTFLAAHNKTKSFYDFANVPLTAAIKHFGEAVLESSGVLTSRVDDYAGVKVRPII